MSKEPPPFDTACKLGTLVGLAVELAADPWVVATCNEEARKALAAAGALSTAAGYPWSKKPK